MTRTKIEKLLRDEAFKRKRIALHPNNPLLKRCNVTHIASFVAGGLHAFDELVKEAKHKRGA